MTRSVPLHEIPTDLRFPHEVEDRIRYNAAERRLEFDGSMSKSDFDRLLPLDSSIAYQRAVEQLFQECSYSTAPPESHVVRNACAAGAAALLLGVLAWMLT